MLPEILMNLMKSLSDKGATGFIQNTVAAAKNVEIGDS